MGKVNIFITLLVIQLIVGFSDAALRIDNESELREAQAALFNLNSETGWLLLNYVDDNTVHMVAGGEGTAEDLVAQLEYDQVQYAIIRVPTSGGNHRDVFIDWIGPEVGLAERTAKALNRGNAEDMLRPFDSSITALNSERLTDENIVTYSNPLSLVRVIA
ncbi:uncharacterized protein LOC119074281 [Bradysia coprophila]|uniref:uncharacterized protein LOC119074281 n=1 Tax=Bradysia coprophila TaxID=38358 RepID=UPI00187D9358|nr:uncharacterized protein LOC119074281 [Bradysia coprophila]